MKYAKILVMLPVVAAANSFAWTYEPRDAKFSPDGSKVVFLSSGGPYGYDIYTVNADGSGKVKFEVPGGLWGEPYFSPDGKKVAFITDDEFLNGNIFLADVDGGNLRRLTNYGDDPYEKIRYPRLQRIQRIGVLDEGLTFSPDGRSILYISEEFGTADVFAINVDGTGKTRLTDFAGWEGEPVFLAGGEEILFNAKGSSEWGIWIINADGSAKKRLSLPENAYGPRAFSPDGKKIVYEECHGDEDGTYVADLDGSSRFKVADELLYQSGLLECNRITFSPDGKKVVYSLYDALYIVNADGTGRKKLTDGWYLVYNPAFFAGGSKIAFVGIKRPGQRYEFFLGDVYTMDADGSNLKLSKTTSGAYYWDLVVSPTSDRFLFKVWGGREDFEGCGSVDYFVGNADGTGLTRLTEGGEPFDPGHGLGSAAFSPDGSKIAYAWCVNGDYHIYTVNADGSGKVRLELKGGLWGEPHFSPDGSKIAFIDGGWWLLNGNIFLVDVDGTNLTQVTAYGDAAPGIPGYPDRSIGVLYKGLTFSPDGRKILYCSAEFGSSDIFAVNVDGTGKTRLTDFAGSEERPVFLAGGDKVLFTATYDLVQDEIWIMSADGSGKKKVPVSGDAKLMAVSRDGKKIIAFGEYPDDKNGLGSVTHASYVADLDGSSRFVIAEEFHASVGYSGSFSPDGKKVLYTHHGIWIIDADGRGRKNLTPGWYSVSKPAFFADGAKIAFIQPRYDYPSRDDIWTMDADGSNQKLFKATDGMGISDFVVSPTGDRFLIRGDCYGEANPSYFAVNADGSGLARISEFKPLPYEETEE